MNAKERFYSGMAKETINRITANKDNWTVNVNEYLSHVTANI